MDSVIDRLGAGPRRADSVRGSGAATAIRLCRSASWSVMAEAYESTKWKRDRDRGHMHPVPSTVPRWPWRWMRAVRCEPRSRQGEATRPR